MLIILILFTLASIAISLWGWKILLNNKKKKTWIATSGVIYQSIGVQESSDLTPHIHYRYEVNGRVIEQELAFPGDLSSPESVKYYLDKYPVGKNVEVFYDGDNPEQSTLERGLGSGDWLVFASGIASTIFGLLLILANI